MNINIKELLDFFDDRKDSQKGDANAIVALLGEDLNASIYKHFRGDNVEILEDSVLSGQKIGKWLDRWITDRTKLYQCEIKNWSASAVGGKRLKSDASDEEIKKVSTYHWNRELNGSYSSKLKHPNSVTKVLLKMKSPEKHKHKKILPLVIYWMPVSSDNKGLNPLSILSIKNINLPIKTEFPEIQIFSVSLYLRQLYKKGAGQKYIDLDLYHFQHRMSVLKKFQNK